MATMNVKDAAGATVAVEKPLAPGRAAATASRPVTFSNEDFAVLDNIETLLAAPTPAGTNNIGDVDVLTVPTDPFGANADAASVSGSVSAKLRAIATALGATALDLGSGTGGTRTLRVAIDTASQTANVANNADAVAASSSLLYTPTVSYLFGYNGTTYDRLQLDSAKSLKTAVQPPLVGGLTPFYTSDLDEAKQQIKGSAGGLFNMIFTNRTTGALWLHFYDLPSASVTVGTTTPTFQIEVPANASDHTMAMPNFNPHGLNFASGITVACTTAQAGTGAPAASALAFFASYK